MSEKAKKDKEPEAPVFKEGVPGINRNPHYGDNVAAEEVRVAAEAAKSEKSATAPAGDIAKPATTKGQK